MKKVLGLVLSVTMLLTMLFAVSGLSVFAADNINLIDKDNATVSTQEGREGTHEFIGDTGLKIHATGSAGYGISFTLNKAFTVAELTKIQLDVKSDVRWNIAFNLKTKGGSGWPQIATDWYTTFQDSAPTEANPGVAGTTFHDVLDLEGFFTYENNAKMPADGVSEVISVSIAVYEPGELTLNWLQLSSADTFEVSADGGSTDATTAPAGDATTAPAATTTVAASNDSAKTGEDTTMVWIMATAMIVAAGVVVVTLRAKKASSK